MSKATKKEPKKVFQLLTTMQSNAYKEQVKKEGQTLYEGAGSQLEKILEANPDPSYLAIYSKDKAGIQEVHRLDYLTQNEYHYDQKAKRDRHFNMKREPDTKQTYSYPLTSNQYYGWREPIDKLAPHFGIKQTFDYKLVVNMKSTKAVKK